MFVLCQILNNYKISTISSEHSFLPCPLGQLSLPLPPPLPLALVVAVSALCSAEQAPLSADYVHLFMLRHFAILGPQMEASEGWVLLFFVVLFLFFSFGVLLLLFSFFKN